MLADGDPYPYDLPCSKAGCSETFKVYTANYESTGLVQAMRFHMESVHCDVAPPPASTKREKADDVNEMVPIINKGLHEMSKEEWHVWNKEWSMYWCLQPAGLNLNVKILSRFPKIRGEIAETIDLATLSKELLLVEIQKLAVKETNVIRM